VNIHGADVETSSAGEKQLTIEPVIQLDRNGIELQHNEITDSRANTQVLAINNP